jgi:hypothetical protein
MVRLEKQETPDKEEMSKANGVRGTYANRRLPHHSVYTNRRCNQVVRSRKRHDEQTILCPLIREGAELQFVNQSAV